MSENDLVLGIDVGSVSVDVAVLNRSGEILDTRYIRHKGRPMQVAADAIQQAVSKYGDGIAICAATGTGGRLVAEVLKGVFVNDVIAQATAAAHMHPEVRTVIEIGGEDSKLIFLKPRGEGAQIADFQMNTVCAAGTGSFLDQQASRLGLTIEEYGQLALKSENPPRVAGRCSVFAKSDMIHLQQKATPVHDIVAGLCFALARNFKSTVGAARGFQKPIAFQGGVAANPGIVRAMESVLGLSEGELVIPKEFGCTGAIGAALVAARTGSHPKPDLCAVKTLLENTHADKEKPSEKPLKIETSVLPKDQSCAPNPTERVPAYLGVDVGSISTNVVVMDGEKRVLAKSYLMTAGRPIEAVRQGLKEVGEEISDLVDIRGACTTGSGRYLIA
ncbi:MAG: acyl-CoA dehydratase activase, partial [Armatimonadetes bacterium]|nr:acyl-CoA dehydratase activase [Armatimonadota bacterium]